MWHGLNTLVINTELPVMNPCHIKKRNKKHFPLGLFNQDWAQTWIPYFMFPVSSVLSESVPAWRLSCDSVPVSDFAICVCVCSCTCVCIWVCPCESVCCLSVCLSLWVCLLSDCVSVPVSLFVVWLCVYLLSDCVSVCSICVSIFLNTTESMGKEWYTL